MAIKIEHDARTSTAAVELPLKQPLPEFDLEKVEAPVPREVDPMLASRGFKDLLDEARSILEAMPPGSKLRNSPAPSAPRAPSMAPASGWSCAKTALRGARPCPSPRVRASPPWPRICAPASASSEAA